MNCPKCDKTWYSLKEGLHAVKLDVIAHVPNECMSIEDTLIFLGEYAKNVKAGNFSKIFHKDYPELKNCSRMEWFKFAVENDKTYIANFGHITEESLEPKKPIRVYVKDWTDTPGPRYAEHGEHSAEKFVDEVLVPLFKKGEDVVIDLDGTHGYASGFIMGITGDLVARGILKPIEMFEHVSWVYDEEDQDSNIQKMIDLILGEVMRFHTNKRVELCPKK